MIVGPTRFRPMAAGNTGARAAAYSSSQITRSIRLAPRPPYSFGHEIPTQPGAYIVFCHARRRSYVSRSDGTRSSAASSRHISGGRFVSSQPRNSLRKASWAGVYSKSIALGPIKRCVALDRHTMAVTALWEVVPHRMMLDAAVVPERDRVHLPAEPALELRRLDVTIEELEQRVALGPLELHDLRGEAAVDVEPLLARHGVRANDGMLGFRERLALVVDAVAATIDVLALVHRGQRLEEALHGLGEGVVRRVHAGEQRVATDRRQ